MSGERDRRSFADIIAGSAFAVGLVTAWLYFAGWSYAYFYFQKFHIPLLMLDVPFQHFLVYGGLVILNYYRQLLLTGAILVGGLWITCKWWGRLNGVAIGTIVAFAVIGLFVAANAGGMLTAGSVFAALEKDGYADFPRVQLSLKEGSFNASAILGDILTNNCGRLVAATKDNLFLIRPVAETAGVTLQTSIVVTSQAPVVRLWPQASNCP